MKRNLVLALILVSGVASADGLQRTTLMEMLEDNAPKVSTSRQAYAYIQGFTDGYHHSYMTMAILRNDADAAEAAWSRCESVFAVDNVALKLQKMLPPRTPESSSNSYTFFWSFFMDDCKPVGELLKKWQEQDKERFGSWRD